MAVFSEEEIINLRMRHESDAEWRLREQFLLAHRESYPKNRLVCLSTCFINVECYGTKYPSGVMHELKDLMEGIIEPLNAHRQRMSKLKESIQFIKSSTNEKDRSAAPWSAPHRGGGHYQNRQPYSNNRY